MMLPAIRTSGVTLRRERQKNTHIPTFHDGFCETPKRER